MHHRVVIVGAGLAGSVIAAALRADGHDDVVTIDCGMKAAGSLPAACLMKPSWFSGLGSNIYDPALKMLDRLYGVQDLPFTVGKLIAQTVHWVNPASVLLPPTHQSTVISILPASDGGWSLMTSSGEVTATTCIVAAGYWSSNLIALEGLNGQAGAALLWADRKTDRPSIMPYAPYRQSVMFNRGDGLWFGDGTSIKIDNFERQHILNTIRRAEGAGVEDPGAGLTVLSGVRPYFRGEKLGVVREIQDGLWVATGGAKNGTLFAGHAAHKISGALS